MTPDYAKRRFLYSGYSAKQEREFKEVREKLKSHEIAECRPVDVCVRIPLYERPG